MPETDAHPRNGGVSQWVRTEIRGILPAGRQQQGIQMQAETLSNQVHLDVRGDHVKVQSMSKEEGQMTEKKITELKLGKMLNLHQRSQEGENEELRNQGPKHITYRSFYREISTKVELISQ